MIEYITTYGMENIISLNQIEQKGFFAVFLPTGKGDQVYL